MDGNGNSQIAEYLKDTNQELSTQWRVLFRMRGFLLTRGGGRRFTLRGFKQNLKKSDTFFPCEPPLFPQLQLSIIIKKFQIVVI